MYEMVNTGMPNANPNAVHPMPTSQPGKAAKGLEGFSHLERVVLINDNTCCEKIKQTLCAPLRTCCCPRRYKLANVAKGYEVGDQKLYTITEDGCALCCCPIKYKVTDRDGKEVNRYTQKCCWFPGFSFCFGGPGFDIHDLNDGEVGKHHGTARVPACQCFNAGYDVRDSSDKKTFFVGDVCNCFKKSLRFEPVWNGDESEVLKMNVHVTPCLKRYLPCFCCCMEDYWVVDFPVKANAPERSELVAGTLMKEVL